MQVLRLEPTDKDALQTKLFLLLQTEQYTAALTLADSAEHAFDFGRAYSLYRLHREHEAAAVLDEVKSTTGSDRGISHLEAQLVCIITVPSLVHIFFISELHLQNYRQGSYQAAFDLYNDLLDSAETVCLDAFHSSHSFEIHPKHARSNPMNRWIFSRISKQPKSIWSLSTLVIYTLSTRFPHH